MDKPQFSIVIPTFNRSRELRRAITAALRQKYTSFEILISDNNSQDNTQKMMGSFYDARIHYVKHKRNIGWIPNLQSAINRSQGKYLLLHGDDDFLLYEDFLKRLHSALQTNPVGFIRVNYLSYSDSQNILFDFHNRQFQKQVMPSGSDDEHIVEFIDSIDPFFITGIVLKGDVLRNIPLVQSEFSPWVPAVYHAIKKEGGLLWPEYEYVATWSKTAAYPRYYLANGKYRFERYFEEIRKHASKGYFRKFLRKRLNILIREFPAAKYYTSNANFIPYALRLLDLDERFRYSIVYWFWVAFSLLTPNALLNALRLRLVEKRKDITIPKLAEIYKKIAFLDKLSDDNA